MIADLLFTSFINLIAYLILIFTLQYLCFGHLKLIRRNLIVCCGISYFSLSVSQLFCSPRFSSVWLVFILFYGTILFFSSRRIIDLLLSPIVFLLYITLKIIPTIMLQTLFPSLEDTILILGEELTILYLLTDAVLLISFFVLHYFISKYQCIFHAGYKAILFSITFPCYSFLLLAVIMFSKDTALKHVMFWKFFPIIAFVVGLIYYFYVLINGQRRIYRENLARTQYAYLRTQLDSLQDLKDKEENIRKMRHDLKNHLTLIESLCAQGNYEKVLSYSDKLNSMYSENISALTGNKIADTIVHTNTKTAQNAGIDFTFEGSLSGLSALSEPDICGLLSNAYDNAMDACLAQEHAYIHTLANSTTHHTYIKIRNSIPKKIRIRHNHLQTTKTDKQSHGYGIEIMKQIAHKYHGSCNISSTDTEFIVEIMLVTTKK